MRKLTVLSVHISLVQEPTSRYSRYSAPVIFTLYLKAYPRCQVRSDRRIPCSSPTHVVPAVDAKTRGSRPWFADEVFAASAYDSHWHISRRPARVPDPVGIFSLIDSLGRRIVGTSLKRDDGEISVEEAVQVTQTGAHRIPSPNIVRYFAMAHVVSRHPTTLWGKPSRPGTPQWPTSMLDGPF